MAKTKDNLQEAFAGESQANRRYLFFAGKVDESGHKKVHHQLFQKALASLEAEKP